MSLALSSDKIDALKTFLGAENVHSGVSVDRFDPGFNPENLDSELVITPENITQIQSLMKWCHQENMSIVPLGGRTGLVGGGISTLGQVTLLTTKLKKVLEINPIGQFAIVESGVTLTALNRAAEPFGLSAGIDLGARDSCTIGGMIATNAGGMEAFRNGCMRNRVLGLEAVMADGSVFDDLTTVLKSNIGYDIKHLLIGSEGTLGIITKAVIQLEPIHTHTCTCLVSFQSATSAIQALRHLAGPGNMSVLRCEIMWRSHFETTARLLNFNSLVNFAQSAAIFVIFEIKIDKSTDLEDVLAIILEGCASTPGFIDALALKSVREKADVWRVREDWAVDRRYPDSLWYDVSVPHERLDTYVTELERSLHQIDKNLLIFVLGHLGDANLHVTISCKNSTAELESRISDCVYKPIKGSGGSFSAEHGIGVAKKKALLTWGDPTRLKFMHTIKAIFDPYSLLNPGKIIS